METYCARRTKQNRLMLLSNCAKFGKKKSRFIKNKEASELLSHIGIRTPLINIPLVVP